MKYLKFMAYNSVQNASRNRRELSAADEYGFDTYCYSSDRKPPENTEGEPFTMICDETPVVTKSVRPKLWRWFRLLVNCFRHASRVKKLKMDVISCHNVRCLAIAYWAYLLTPKSRKPKFIYDSHEVELRKKKRGKAAFAFTKALEGFLIKRCSFTIIPCDDPADFLQETYGLEERPVVVRSVPNYWTLDPGKIRKRKEEFTSALGIPSDSFIAIYTGFLVETRGLEEIIDAMEKDQRMYTVWVGEALKPEYEKYLMDMVEEKGVGERLLRLPLVPQDTLWEYVGAADVSIIAMDYIKNENYKTALPNKFFEAIQSETPVICADSVEMKRIVHRYGIGLLVPAEDGEAVAEAVKSMRDDESLYLQIKDNMKTAKKALCWENEKKRFFKAFDRYLVK